MCRYPQVQYAILAIAWNLLADVDVSAGVIRGTVKTSAGQPIRRVNVSLEGPQSPKTSSRIVSTTTDENGNFEFKKIAPGNYHLRAEKPGWISTDAWIAINDSTMQQDRTVNIVMELTFVRKVLANIQRGSLAYVLLFGVAVLAFNYFLAPDPSNGVMVAGWSIIAVCIGIACFKLEPSSTFLFAALGVVAGAAVHWTGLKAASARRRKEQEEFARLRDAEQRDRKQFESFLGQEGITITDLKTCGSAAFGEEILQVRALRGFIPKDTRVVIRKFEGRVPIVDRHACESITATGPSSPGSRASG